MKGCAKFCNEQWTMDTFFKNLECYPQCIQMFLIIIISKSKVFLNIIVARFHDRFIDEL